MNDRPVSVRFEEVLGSCLHQVGAEPPQSLAEPDPRRRLVVRYLTAKGADRRGVCPLDASPLTARPLLTPCALDGPLRRSTNGIRRSLRSAGRRLCIRRTSPLGRRSLARCLPHVPSASTSDEIVREHSSRP